MSANFVIPTVCPPSPQTTAAPCLQSHGRLQKTERKEPKYKFNPGTFCYEVVRQSGSNRQSRETLDCSLSQPSQRLAEACSVHSDRLGFRFQRANLDLSDTMHSRKSSERCNSRQFVKTGWCTLASEETIAEERKPRVPRFEGQRKKASPSIERHKDLPSIIS